MPNPGPSPDTVHFDAFEVDLLAGEVRKHGYRIKIQDQPFRVLQILLEHPGKVVRREELQHAIWPSDTFVDFDRGLNNAIKRLREALGDSAENPQFVETVPRRGYRFIGQIDPRNPKFTETIPNPVYQLLAKVGSKSTAALSGEIQRQRAWVAVSRNFRFGVATALAGIVVFALLAAGVSKYWHLRASANSPSIRVIAVLPLKDPSDDPEQKYFADGVTDELITALSQVRALTVISRTSSETYANTNASLPQIARELGADAVVKGTYMRSAGRVRVTAQLIRVTTGKQVWEGSFEAELGELVTQQRRLARKIAVAVAAQFTPEESQRLARSSPVNPQAYNDYLLGEYYMWNRLNPDGRQEAIRYLEHAVAEDPTFAPAHASLSQAYFREAPELNNSRTNELFERSKALAFKAAELDDSLADAHRMLGVIYYVSWEVAAAGKEFERAVELQPGDARNLYFHAIYLDSKGLHEEAISEARHAAAMDPLNVSVQSGVGKMYLYAGHNDEAIAEFKRILEEDPSAVEIRGYLAAAYEQKGDYPDALAELEKGRSDRLASAGYVSMMGYIYARQGNAAEASASLRELVRMSRTQGYDVSPLDFATIYAGMGNADKSIAWLQRAYDQHAQFLLEIASIPQFASLHTDPRFRDLVRRMGLE